MCRGVYEREGVNYELLCKLKISDIENFLQRFRQLETFLPNISWVISRKESVAIFINFFVNLS